MTRKQRLRIAEIVFCCRNGINQCMEDVLSDCDELVEIIGGDPPSLKLRRTGGWINRLR